MANKKDLVAASTFFDNENKEMVHELDVSEMLVDIACEFIKYRASHNMTQGELAEKLDITQAMVSKLESGDYNPTVRMLYEIAQKMGWEFNIEFSSDADSKKSVGRHKLVRRK